MAITAAHSDADIDRVIEIFKAAVDDMFENSFLGSPVERTVGDVHQRVRLVDGTNGEVSWAVRDDRQESNFKIVK